MAYAFAVNFSQLEKWDVLSASLPRRYHVTYPLVDLSEVVKVRFSPVQKTEIISGNVSMLEKVSFDGEIFSGKENSKMQQFLAKPGDLIVSKIRARQGSIGLVNENDGNLSVTIHYRVLILQKNLDSLYAWLTLRSRYGRAQFLSATGGAMKGEISEEELLKIKLPLPSLETQHAIVSRWHQAQHTIAQAKEKISELEKGIDKQFFADLGLKTAAYIQNLKVFTAHWKDFERWSVSYNQAVLGSIDISKGRYPVAELGSILSMAQYGSSEKANEKEKGVPVLRINNIKNGVFELSDLKHIPLHEKVKRNLLMEDGDILIIRTSGSKDLVGTCAVFHEQKEFVFASYLIRLRVDRARVNPDYVAWLINSLIGRQQIDALSRQIMQSNINSQELRSLKIPLPPLQAQQEIMSRVEAGRAEIARQKELAEKIRKDSEAEIEALILGTKKI